MSLEVGRSIARYCDWEFLDLPCSSSIPPCHEDRGIRECVSVTNCISCMVALPRNLSLTADKPELSADNILKLDA